MPDAVDDQERRIEAMQARMALSLDETFARIRDRSREDALDHLEALGRRAWLDPEHPLGLPDAEREKARDFVVKLASDRDDAFRPLALFTLGAIGLSAPAVHAALVQALDDRASYVRENAVRALEGLADERTRLRARLLGALHDSSVAVRTSAVFVMGRGLSPNTQELAAVLLALDDPADGVSLEAGRTLHGWVQAGMVELDLVASQVAHKSPSAGGVFLLRGVDRLGAEYLIDALRADHTRVLAIGALEARGPEELARGLRVLEEIGRDELADLVESFRLDAPAEVLGTTWLSALMELARHGSETVRLVAIDALARFDRWRAVVGSDLEEMAATEAEPFATAAREALAALQSRKSRPSVP